jgi:UDP-glucose 4-epimerase
VDDAPFRRILVLGHSGYIGSRLLVHLRRTEPALRVAGCSIRELDLTSPGADGRLAELIDSDTALIVCAAIKKQAGDTPDALMQNVAIALNVASAVEMRSPQRLVFFSSAAVYGEDVAHERIDESTPVEPTSLYGIGKLAAERLLARAASRTGRTSFLVLRPPLVYGPDEPAYYYGPSGFLRKAVDREPITLWGDGSELREFLYVDDIVEIARRLLLAGSTGVVNVASGTSYSYAAALNMIAELLGAVPAINHRARTKALVDHRFETRALRDALPDFTFTPLDRGLAAIAGARVIATPRP